MPSTRDIRRRIKSVKNTAQITKAMQMVAAAKMRKAQQAALVGSPYADLMNAILAEAGPRIASFKHPLMEIRDVKKRAIIVVSSDRGLCGGLNSGVGRVVSATVKARAEAGTETVLVGVGDKTLSNIAHHGPKVLFSFGETSKRSMSFFAISEMVEPVLKEQFDSVSVAYNKFVSIISTKPTIFDMSGYQTILESPLLDLYEFESDDRIPHTQDAFEFNLASVLYGAYTENMASELGSRMSAMDSATRNAGDMLKKLEVWYNRGRQAAITTELTEIISGAAAIE